MGVIHTNNDSWLQTVTVQTTNAQLFTLPAGPVAAAGDLEWGDHRVHRASGSGDQSGRVF